MRSSEIMRAVRYGLHKAGIPDHVIGIEKDSPKISIRVLIGGRLVELSVRATATKAEVDAKIAEFRNRWQEHKGIQGVIE